MPLPAGDATGILLEGLAPDGGLFVPDAYPVILVPELKALRAMTYPQLAYAILSKFAGDIPGSMTAPRDPMVASPDAS